MWEAREPPLVLAWAYDACIQQAFGIVVLSISTWFDQISKVAELVDCGGDQAGPNHTDNAGFCVGGSIVSCVQQSFEGPEGILLAMNPPFTP